MSVKLLRRGGLVLVLGLVVAALSLSLSLAEEKPVVTAIGYSDLVRFQAQEPGVATLRVEVFNLGGQRLFDSGPVQGQALDWRMMNEQGKRVAYGVYLYVTTAWSANGEMLEQRVGKIALTPGEMGLGLAPPLISEDERVKAENERVKPEMVYNEDVIINGNNGLVFDEGSLTTMRLYSRHELGVSDRQILEAKPEVNDQASFQFYGGRTWADGAFFEVYGDDVNGREAAVKISAGSRTQANTNNTKIYFQIQTNAPSTINAMAIDKEGKVGIGTTSPSATLEVHGSQSDLLALYDPADTSGPKFKVQKDGDVYADGSYNCGLATQDACFNTGVGADVAERINTSEWVEQGNVVEIDPEHPGFFRKARGPYSTLVAGVISTTPAITMGNNFDAKADIWKDNRPLLALAGRVPVKATTENGPIQVGDLLVSSSTPGYAMRCGDDRAACVGATIGKALEPLEEGTGMVMAQITLR